ncbi:hypothetical protein [Pseudanabaena sp. FACHB-2040]|uniref:hypothetical protein n=1 Tax=Pseudanabaena sp. FACHB-2040 TaxID=2692859 RepID=UPI0016858882|nr:hypothetical protein [Pseudanabaena sp. FACHB-2040]MBD2258600.1 hypothetical protein [Pseudanabaena sp. FACHB-2040]
MLTLKQLRQDAYQNWEVICIERGVYNPAPDSIGLPPIRAEQLPITNTAFKNEIRKRFGDLRRHATWKQAAVWMAAQGVSQSYLEPYQIVGYLVSPGYMNDLVRQHYGKEVIEAMLQFPEVLGLIRDGLEQIQQNAEYHRERALVEQFVREGHPLPTVGAIAIAA